MEQNKLSVADVEAQRVAALAQIPRDYLVEFALESTEWLIYEFLKALTKRPGSHGPDGLAQEHLSNISLLAMYVDEDYDAACLLAVLCFGGVLVQKDEKVALKILERTAAGAEASDATKRTEARRALKLIEAGYRFEAVAEGVFSRIWPSTEYNQAGGLPGMLDALGMHDGQIDAALNDKGLKLKVKNESFSTGECPIRLVWPEFDNSMNSGLSIDENNNKPRPIPKPRREPVKKPEKGGRMPAPDLKANWIDALDRGQIGAMLKALRNKEGKSLNDVGKAMGELSGSKKPVQQANVARLERGGGSMKQVALYLEVFGLKPVLGTEKIEQPSADLKAVNM